MCLLAELAQLSFCEVLCCVGYSMQEHQPARQQSLAHHRCHRLMQLFVTTHFGSSGVCAWRLRVSPATQAKRSWYQTTSSSATAAVSLLTYRHFFIPFFFFYCNFDWHGFVITKHILLVRLFYSRRVRAAFSPTETMHRTGQARSVLHSDVVHGVASKDACC